jgi:cobalt-zinc-cadmium efflux system outer membrane protein
MSTSSFSFILCALSVLAWPALSVATDPPLHSVEKAVSDRTGIAMRWQQDAAAREEALTRVRALLKKPLTVNSAVRIALLNNRDWLAALEDVGISAADLREAGLWKNPSIDLSIRFPNRGSLVADNEVGAALDVLDLLMLPLRKRVAAERLVAMQLRVSDQALRLVAEVKEAVYALQADEALLAQRRSIVELNAGAIDLAQRQHAAGNITDLALASQQSVYDSARLEAATAENRQREDREKLNRLLSLWGPDIAWTLAGGLPSLPEVDVSLHGLESLAITQRLDLAAAHAELSSLVRALGLTKTYRYIGALEFGVNSEREPEGERITGPTMRLEIPLFNQGQARVAKGEAELRQAERRLEGIAIDIRSDVRALHDKLAALRETVRFYQDQIVPNHRVITADTQLRYNGMLVGNFELFEARAEQIETEQKSIEALRDYWMTRAQLERAVGGNLHARPNLATARK